jgi:hypothetical protein
MLRLIWIASIHIRYYLRRYAPTNILLDAIRTRRGLKWGIPAMLLAAPYLYAAAICTTIIDQGGPGWLNILAVLFIWNAFKMLWIGPVSLVLLARVRAAEWKARTRYPSANPPQTTGNSPEMIRYA